MGCIADVVSSQCRCLFLGRDRYVGRRTAGDRYQDLPVRQRSVLSGSLPARLSHRPNALAVIRVGLGYGSDTTETSLSWMADHDPSYKLLFSHRDLVADLIRGFVHEDWVAQLDFTT